MKVETSEALKISGTLPETNIAPENGWLEYYFPIGVPADFQVLLLLGSGRYHQLVLRNKNASGLPSSRTWEKHTETDWMETLRVRLAVTGRRLQCLGG